LQTAKDIDSAESTVIAQLQKDHAPQKVVSEERALLEKASLLAHHAAEEQLDATSEVAQKKVQQQSEVTAEETQKKAASESQSAVGALRSYADSMANLVKSDDSMIKQTDYVKGEALKALSSVKASAADKSQVSELLNKAESLEHNVLSLDEKSKDESMAESLKEESLQTAKDIDSAESTVIAQLQKDHAPQKVVSEERALLEKASLLAHHAAEEQLDATSEVAQQKAAILIEVGSDVSQDSDLRSITAGMGDRILADSQDLGQMKSAKVEAMEALADSNASAAEEGQVSELMDTAASLEVKGLMMDKDIKLAMQSMQLKPATALRGAARQEGTLELAAKNRELKMEHSKLKRDHLLLAKQVADQNEALELENRELHREDDELQRALGKMP